LRKNASAVPTSVPKTNNSRRSLVPRVLHDEENEQHQTVLEEECEAELELEHGTKLERDDVPIKPPSTKSGRGRRPLNVSSRECRFCGQKFPHVTEEQKRVFR
jgi:hypothetical protein